MTLHLGLARVERHADPQRGLVRPWFSKKSMLKGTAGGHGSGGMGEDGEETIPFALALHDHAGMLLNDRGEEGVVAGQSRPHRLGVLFPEAGAPLDVGEQE